MISTATFDFVADLLRRETAMLCEPGKEYLVEARLLPLARAAGDPDVDRYAERLRREPAERSRAVDALTINETSWFRDLAPYQAFADVMLPRLLEARRERQHLDIWSAACSSGQEAYSIAMLLDEQLPAGWTARIHCTDVATTMLERVKNGRYSQVEMNRGMPANRLVRYFSRVGTEWEVAPELRRMITTEQLNLAGPFPSAGGYDVIFLRNVLIYFDMDTKRDILRRMSTKVASHGYLLLGSSETTLDLDDSWVREPSGRVSLHQPRVAPARVTSLAAASLASAGSTASTASSSVTTTRYPLAATGA